MRWCSMDRARRSSSSVQSQTTNVGPAWSARLPLRLEPFLECRVAAQALVLEVHVLADVEESTFAHGLVKELYGFITMAEEGMQRRAQLGVLAKEVRRSQVGEPAVHCEGRRRIADAGGDEPQVGVGLDRVIG